MTAPRPVTLIVLDGWGLSSPPETGNAIALADTPTFDRIVSEYPNATLRTSGARRRAAGRPNGQQRGRAPQPGRRVRRRSGPDATRSRNRGRLVPRQSGARHGRRRRRHARRHAAPDGVDRRRRRSCAHRHLVALVELAKRPGCRAGCACTRSPTGATPRPTALWASCATSRQSSARSASVAWPPSPAGTGRWIAIDGGTGRPGRGRLSSTGEARTAVSARRP